MNENENEKIQYEIERKISEEIKKEFEIMERLGFVWTGTLSGWVKA